MADEPILLAVCTRDRPRMLRRCLASVAAQAPVAGAALSAVVIDNGDDPAAAQARAIAAEVAGAVPIEVAHELARGIPQARNRAIATALAQGAAALVFIDDDQSLPADWAATVVRVWREEGVDAVETPVTWDFEGSGRYRAFFERARDLAAAPPREVREAVPSTNGVLVARRVYDDLGLRFDPALALTGGEDTAFFRAARARGCRFVLTRETRAVEHCPAGKETWRWILRRAYRVGTTGALLRRGQPFYARYVLREVVMLPAAGLAALLLAPLAARSLKWLHYAATAARAAGILAGTFGHRAEEYRDVVGD